MRRSLPLLIMLCAGLALSACASRKPPKIPKPPPKPLYAGHTATMDITNGIAIIGTLSLPSEFMPNTDYSPIWLAQGREIAIVGSIDGKAAVLGLSGQGFADRRIIAEDFGASAPGGRIVDIAASPDGPQLATAVVEPTQNRIEVLLRDTGDPREGHAVASVEGSFEFVQIAFPGATTIALVLRASSSGDSNAANSSPSGGIYLITADRTLAVHHLDKISCVISKLSFSPNEYFAVGQGDPSAPVTIFDLHDQTCRPLAIKGPIRVLSWSANSAAFLYRAYDENGGVSVFRFDMTTGRSSLVAISSGAAAYTSDGTIIALGNSELSWRRIAAQPARPVKAEIALFDPRSSEIRLNSLGFETSPALLAQSRMVFSSVSDDALIDTAIAGAVGPLRELIEYSYPARAAFVLASGPVEGPVMASWSPDGKLIALVDGNHTLRMLTVIGPPR